MGFLFGERRSHLNYTAIVAGALLCFVFIATSAASAATFKAVNGEVVIEAENYTRLGGTIGGKWYIDKKISGYTGAGYIQSTTAGSGTTLKFNKSIIRAEYDINFQETGTYYLHLRTYATDHAQNGFHATMDGRLFNYGHRDAAYIFVKKNSRWCWYTDGGGIHGKRGYKVSINITKKGVQKLAIYRRDSGGSRVDQIWLTKKQSAPQNTGTLSLTNPAVFIDGVGSRSTPPPEELPSPPLADGTRILLEAEEFDANVERGDHAWVSASHQKVSAMEAVPDSGARIGKNYVEESPYLSFNVNFAKTGTYYIWLKGFCTGRDSSAHVGLNGRSVATARNINLPVERAWVWSGTTASDQRATVTVDRTGTQTIEVYMREDGLILDKILLATSADYTPSDE